MYDIIIIGKGPAGLSAAIYAGRAGAKTLVLGKQSKMDNPHAYDNYFGFSSGTTGGQLLREGEMQAIKFGAELHSETVIGASKGETFKIETETGSYESKALIIATGAPVKSSGITNEADYSGKGVSYCVTCDGFFFKNRKVALVGNADFAAHEAIELLRFTKNVTIFTQGKPVEISVPLMKKLSEAGVIIREDTIEAISGKDVMKSVVIHGKEELFDGVFIAVGLAGSADFARKLGLSLQGNFIIVDAKMFTGVDGAFAAGDCRGGIFQVAQCVGDGAMAAKGALNYLEKD